MVYILKHFILKKYKNVLIRLCHKYRQLSNIVRYLIISVRGRSNYKFIILNMFWLSFLIGLILTRKVLEVDNKFSKDISDSFWQLLAILFTGLTIVFSIYYPPIIKDIQHLSVGFNQKLRRRLIGVNAVSSVIKQMVLSMVFMALVLFILYLVKIPDNYQKPSFILSKFLIIFSIIIWVLEIYNLAKSDYTNYTLDSLLVLSTDLENQRGYYSVINRQLYAHLKNGDWYNYNNELINITDFINKPNQCEYCYDFCIRSFVINSDEEDYINFIIYTHENSVKWYYFNRQINQDFFRIPATNIDRFQNYAFATNFSYLEKFITLVVIRHAEDLSSEGQEILIEYYLWLLEMLCIMKHDYVFTFAIDMIRSFHEPTHAYTFLQDALKIILYRENGKAASGLFRGYFILLNNKNITFYELLEESDGSTALLFKDLIYLTMINVVLNSTSTEDLVYDQVAIKHCFQFITASGIKNDELFEEWLTFIYFFNKMYPTKIRLDDLLSEKIPILADRLHLLRSVCVDEKLINVNEKDAQSFRFTRAVEDHDFFEHPKIQAANFQQYFDDYFL